MSPVSSVSRVCPVNSMSLHQSCELGQCGLVPSRPVQLPTKRVYAELRARLDANEWQPGEQLPSVTVLAEEHSTSRATMTKVLHLLADAGLVTVVPHWGTFRAEEPRDE
jgi:DNA-binding FadR family transcriptional regulator